VIDACQHLGQLADDLLADADNLKLLAVSFLVGALLFGGKDLILEDFPLSDQLDFHSDRFNENEQQGARQDEFRAEETLNAPRVDPEEHEKGFVRAYENPGGDRV